MRGDEMPNCNGEQVGVGLAHSAPRVVVLGNSHTQSLKDALKKENASAKGDVEFSVKWIYTPGSGPQMDITVHDALKFVANLRATDLVAISLAGTHHNIYGFLRHEVAFDIAPFQEDISDAKIDIIPVNVLKSEMSAANRARGMLPKIKAATRAAVYHIAPPPPKADEAFIRSRMRQYRGKLLESYGLNPPSLRQKMWKLEMDVLETVCSEWNIGFLSPPPEAFTQDGFLHADFYGSDATHANALYGKLVLTQLARLI